MEWRGSEWAVGWAWVGRWEGGAGRVANRGEEQGGYRESEKPVDAIWLKHLKRHDLLKNS